jgi:hypothetical protein
MTEKHFKRHLRAIGEDIARVAAQAKGLLAELEANEIFVRMSIQPQNFGTGEQGVIESYRVASVALRKFHDAIAAV